MNHAECERLLAAYRDLAGEERARVDEHLQACPQCAGRLAAYQRLDGAIRRLPDAAATPRLRESVHAALAGEGSGGRRLWTGRLSALAQAGLVVALSLVGLLLAYVWTQPGRAPTGGVPAAGSTIAVPSPQPTPTLSTPGPGVADILANPPAPGERVDLDAYYSGAGAALLPSGPPPPEDTVACPYNWVQALTDRPFPAMLSLLNGIQGNMLPEDEAWLVAVSPEGLEPGGRTMPQLPYHARLRGYLGEPALANCSDAARIFVVEEVVKVYEETSLETAPQAGPPAGYESWPRYQEAALGFSLPYPPDWQVVRLDDVTVSLVPPDCPGYALTVRVHEGETTYDQFDPGSAPPLLQGQGWSAYEQGLSYGQPVAGSQGLAGWVVEHAGQPGEGSRSVIFSGNGRTYELALRYPTGFAARQDLLTAYTAMVEGFRLDAAPGPSPTPPVEQALGPGPFLSADEALASLHEGEDVELLGAELVSEAEARRRGGACNLYSGHSEGVWELTVRGTFDGQLRTLRLYVDAVSGARLCGEEIALESGAPTPTPAISGLKTSTQSYPSPGGVWTAEATLATPSAGQVAERYYTRLQITRNDGATVWTPVDAWPRWGRGYTFPVPLHWSHDGRYLYYTNRPVPDGCAPFVNGSDLQRVDLADGSVSELLPPSGLWLALSPDERQVAYIALGHRGLVICDLETGAEREVGLSDERSWAAGHIVWSPDGRALALTLANEPCAPGTDASSGVWARSTSILWVDAQTLGKRALVLDDERRFVTQEWATDERIALQDGNGDGWWLDVATGKLAEG